MAAGVGSQASAGDADEFNDLVGSLQRGSKDAKELSQTLIRLTEIQRKRTIAARTETSDIGSRLKALQTLHALDLKTTEGLEALSGATSDLAEGLSETVGILTKDAEAALDRQRAAFRAMAQQKQKDTNTQAIFGKRAADSEIAVYEKMAAKQRGLAMSSVYSGNSLGALKSSIHATALSAGSAAGSMGKYIGMTAEGMGKLAMAAGAALAVINVTQSVYKSAVDASKAGGQFSSGWEATTAGLNMAYEAQKASASMFKSVSSDEVMQTLIETNKDYGSGLVTTGAAYTQAIYGNQAYRNSLISGGFDVLVDAGKIGQSLGMTFQESAKIVNSIHKTARMGGTESVRMFSALVSESRRLQMPLEGLMEVFDDLASSASFLGTNTESVMGDMRGLSMAVAGLSGSGGFKNMDSAMMQESAKALSSFMTSMDSIRVAAITQRGGEGSFQAIYRAGSDKFGGAEDSFQAIMKQYPELRSQLASMYDAKTGALRDPKTEGQAMALAEAGAMMGQTDVTNARLNKLLVSHGMQGKFGAGTLAKLSAEDIDSRLDSTKSVGTQLGAGANVYAVMANTLIDILKGVNQLVGYAAGGIAKNLLGYTPQTPAAGPASRRVAPQAPRPYGSRKLATTTEAR